MPDVCVRLLECLRCFLIQAGSFLLIRSLEYLKSIQMRIITLILLTQEFEVFLVVAAALVTAINKSWQNKVIPKFFAGLEYE